MNIFLDTNILLDVFIQRLPEYESSSVIWGMAENKTVDAFISAISFNNVHYILRKHSGKACAQHAVEVLHSNFNIAPLEQGIIGKAIKAGFSDFEDAIQFFSALSVHADYIITRNTRDFPQDVLPILTPEAFLSQFPFDD